MFNAPAMLLLFVLFCQESVSDRAEIEIRNWRPGPKVTAELARLERESRQIYRAFLNGKLDQWSVIREQARRKIAMDIHKVWSYKGRSDEVQEFEVVVAGSTEVLRVFHRGTDHLPFKLTPGETYPVAS
jgi:hypothetical protein